MYHNIKCHGREKKYTDIVSLSHSIVFVGVFFFFLFYLNQALWRFHLAMRLFKFFRLYSLCISFFSGCFISSIHSFVHSIAFWIGLYLVYLFNDGDDVYANSHELSVFEKEKKNKSYWNIQLDIQNDDCKEKKKNFVDLSNFLNDSHLYDLLEFVRLNHFVCLLLSWFDCVFCFNFGFVFEIFHWNSAFNWGSPQCLILPLSFDAPRPIHSQLSCWNKPNTVFTASIILQNENFSSNLLIFGELWIYWGNAVIFCLFENEIKKIETFNRLPRCIRICILTYEWPDFQSKKIIIFI